MTMYDYVVVGGGSAGCVLAARLSEEPETRVLLIEAGPKDSNPYIHMPVGFFKMTSGPLIWGYETAPLRHANNRRAVYPQARVLGGGKNMMLGNLIELQFGQGRNWPLGAALSITLLVIVTLALLVYVRNAGKSGGGHGH